MNVRRQSLIQLASSVTDLPLSANSSWSHSPLCCGADIGAARSLFKTLSLTKHGQSTADNITATQIALQCS